MNFNWIIQSTSISSFGENGSEALFTPAALPLRYYGNACTDVVFLAIYQGTGCHATTPCAIIKVNYIQPQTWLL